MTNNAARKKRRAEVVQALGHLTYDDPERAHADADTLLLQWLEALGEIDVVAAYKEARAGIGFWYA